MSLMCWNDFYRFLQGKLAIYFSELNPIIRGIPTLNRILPKTDVG